MLPSVLRGLVLAVVGLVSTSTAALSQTPASRTDPPIAWGSLQIERDQPTRLRLMGRTADPDIAAALERIAGQPPQTQEYSDWVDWSIELPVPSRRGLILRQEFHLDPILEVLHARGEPGLSFLIQHPPAGFATFTG